MLWLAILFFMLALGWLDRAFHGPIQARGMIQRFLNLHPKEQPPEKRDRPISMILGLGFLGLAIADFVRYWRH